MRRLSCFLFALTFSYLALPAQTCCAPAADSPTAEFAALGTQKAFQNAHANPQPLAYQDAKGKDVSFLTPDGKTGQGYYIGTEQATGRYLLLIHEWWGLNDHIRQEAENWYATLEDVNVLAIDLYDGKVATERKQAAEFMQGVKEERAKAIIQGALNNMGPDAQVQTIGWCFGGGWSHQAAIMAGAQAQGCIIYYGMPESDPEKLKPLQADVLGIFAGQDKWINGEVVAKFEAAMQSAGKNLTARTFDAAHAFANPSRDIYDAQAAQEARQMSLDFLKAHFK